MHIFIVTYNKELFFYVISFELPATYLLRVEFSLRDAGGRQVKSKEASIFFSESLFLYLISSK